MKPNLLKIKIFKSTKGVKYMLWFFPFNAELYERKELIFTELSNVLLGKFLA